MPLQFFQYEGYLAALILISIALLISGAILVLNQLLGQKPKEVTKVKGDVYECGVQYVGDAHQQFSVRYYLVGIIFLIFDVEVVFMYPWTLALKTYKTQGPFILVEMVFFLFLLFGGYLYLRRRKAFNWD